MWTEQASRVFYAAYLDYEERLQLANAQGVVQHSKVSMGQLIPNYIHRCFEGFYKHQTTMTASELLDAVRQHAGYTTTSNRFDTSRAAADLRRVLSMRRDEKQGGETSVKDRAMMVNSAMEKYFAENHAVHAMYRAQDRSWLPGPAEFVSMALVDGLWPSEFKKYVKGQLTYAAGWKKDPALVMDQIFSAAEQWKFIEAYGRKDAAGAAEPRRQQQQKPKQQQSAKKSFVRVCFECGDPNHYVSDCPKARGGGTAPSSGGRGSSGYRGGRNGGRGRFNHGRGRGGRGGNQLTAGGGTSAVASSTSGAPAAGAAGSGSGSSVAGRAVYVGGAGTSVGAAGARTSPSTERAESVSGAAAGAVAPEPSVYSTSWSGWTADSISSAPAVGGQPWRQVTLGTDQSSTAGEVPVDRSAECLRADLSLPGSVGSLMARVILDSGSALTSIGVGLLQQLSSHFGGADLQIPFENGPQQAKTATGVSVMVTHKTVPIAVSVRTPWGAVKLEPITFAVMPGTDNVVLFGMATMKALGIDVYREALEKLRPRAVPVSTGVETPSYLAARRVTVSVRAFQTEATVDAPEDKAVEHLVDRGPDMFMDPEEERTARERALEDSVQQAEQSGLSVGGATRLREILARRVGAFRRALCGDPPAQVEPMRVQLKQQAKPVKATPRRYEPTKRDWLSKCIAALVFFGFVYHNIQAVWASPAMAVPKKDSFRLVSDYSAVNAQVEKSPGVMPNHEDMGDLLGARFFGKLDLLQGYWQMPLAPEAQDVFTMATSDGLFTPTRVPQGVLNATSYFQGVMTEVLRGLDCKVWVDDVFFFADTEEALLQLLDDILERLENVGLFVAAHKCTFFSRELVWCGKVYSNGVVSHDPARVQGLSEMRRPENAGELMQFLQAVNWLRTSLPRLAETVAPLRDFLEELLVGATRRTKRVARNRVIKDTAWTEDRVRAWNAARGLVAQAVPLHHPRPGCVVLMFPDASDFHWGSFLTQVPEHEFRSGLALESMSHEPLGFLSGSFTGSQLRWATVDKEGFAIVNTFRRLEYLLWGGVHIFTDHRNLQYIFNPEKCVTTVTKTMAQRLENWKGVLGQYRYAIEHIPGDRNCWGDLLSRWVKVPTVPVRSVAVHSPCNADDSLPALDVIRASQQRSVARIGVGVHEFSTTFGQATLADDGLFRVRVGVRDVLWIPPDDLALQTRLMVCAHMRSAGHRGVAPTLFRLKEYCVWPHMDSQVREFVRQCLHCVDTRAGALIPRPYGDTVHGTAPGEVVHFDFLYVGHSGPEGSDGLPDEDGFRYVLVIMDDLSNYVALEPAEACTAEVTAKHLLAWCKTLGVPRVWVSDTATHFKNRVLALLSDALHIEHRFAVAYTPWSNGTCERMVKEVVRALRSILSEQRRQVSEWVDVLPAAQWALNTSFRERYRSTPYSVMFGRAPRTDFSALVSESDGRWNVDVMNADLLRANVREVVAEQERFCADIRAAVAVSRDNKRKQAQGQVVLPKFAVGDFVLYARVRRQGATPKLLSTWTGPWRVVAADHDHVYSVQNIVSGKVHQAHVARLRFYADATLNVTADLKDVFQHSFAQGECRMNALVHVAEDDANEVIVLVDWDGFEAEERTWESLRSIYSAAPEFVVKELRKLRMTRALKIKIASEFSIDL
ncbi:MAG: reverse transcriptase domain-containing protein [Marinobacter sp.]|uniref:reverse transcriptase domain-containing protein n=1 Tax=Pseudomonadota TaxID=1224 RepID=UPI0032647570